MSTLDDAASALKAFDAVADLVLPLIPHATLASRLDAAERRRIDTLVDAEEAAITVGEEVITTVEGRPRQ